jgi:hypothetical protein
MIARVSGPAPAVRYDGPLSTQCLSSERFGDRLQSERSPNDLSAGVG